MSVVPDPDSVALQNKLLTSASQLLHSSRITGPATADWLRCASSQANPNLRFGPHCVLDLSSGFSLAFTSFCPWVSLTFALHRDNSVSTFHSASVFHGPERQGHHRCAEGCFPEIAGAGGAAERLKRRRTTLQKKMRKLIFSRADWWHGQITSGRLRTVWANICFPLGLYF